MRCGLHFNWWLTATAFASPLVIEIEPRIKDSNSDGSHNLSLSNDRPLPWGPKQFECLPQSVGPNTIDLRSVYGLALLMATRLAIGDFDGELPNNPETFVNVAFPHIGAAVYRPNPRQPVPRKYVHWALARIVNQIIRDQDYKDNTYFLFWTDRNRAKTKVGEVYLGPSPPRMGVSSGSSQPTSLLSQVLNSTDVILAAGSEPRNDTQVSVDSSNNGLTYHYQYYGDEMTIADVVIGTLGSINEAAEYQDRSVPIKMFVGSFPQYYAFCVWTSVSPRFTYSVLVQALRTAAVAAMNAHDFHEVKVILTHDGVEVAKGGYVKKPDITHASIATS
ncbi:MAG: hypothetical protein Q9195_008911 [Heterodermia aff. obscurata]